jgi:hypothetical protein
MHSMCAPRVTRQMSRRYSHSRQTLSSMSCVTFPDCGVDALSQFWECLWKCWDVNIALDETPQEETTHCQVWWPGWPGAEGVVCGRCTTNPLQFMGQFTFSELLTGNSVHWSRWRRKVRKPCLFAMFIQVFTMLPHTTFQRRTVCTRRYRG